MLPGDGLVKPKHVGAFTVNLNVNFNILKQLNYALVGRIQDLITSRCTVQLWKLWKFYVRNYEKNYLLPNVGKKNIILQYDR